MSQPAAAQDDDPGRKREARERAAGQVSDVLLNLEWTLDKARKARKARKAIAKDGVDTNAELALGDALRDLERVHKRLVQDTYFAVGERLL